MREPAPAKLNPVLRVLGRRGDGFHEIETVVLPLTLADGVEARRDADGVSLAVTGPLAGDVPRDEENLVLRAARELASAAGIEPRARMLLVKRVPVGAGLGGGSSDAAAAIRALNDVWGLGWAPQRLAEVGAAIGSDVPAMLHGGPVVARGRGELVERLGATRTWWVLAVQPFQVSAEAAYSWWDGSPATGPPIDAVVTSLQRGDASALAATLRNDLAAPVEQHHPEAGEARRRLTEAGALSAVVSGSGPTVAGLCRDGVHAEQVAAAVDGIAVASLAH